MLPVMLLARKLDAEDPNLVYMLRIAYGVLQCIAVSLIVYVYLQAMTLSSKNKALADQIIYVPLASSPFADPNEKKKKYTETTYGAQVMSAARSLVSSTLFGIAMTVGLHYYKGMVVGLAMQTILTPFNLAENALVKALFWKKSSDTSSSENGSTFRLQDRVFDEKIAADLSPEDEIVDSEGNPVKRVIGAAAAASKDNSESKETSLEDLLLDTWDAGNKADLSPLMKALNSKNCNYQTKEDSWTPLMVLAGLGAANGTASAIRHVKELGADVAMVDKEGWTALHWAAFHGSVVGAKELSSETQLLSVTDKDGNTPIDTARKEKNDEVADIFEAALGESKKSK